MEEIGIIICLKTKTKINRMSKRLSCGGEVSILWSIK